ncbi:MAG: hypothetical protein IPL33_20360 [Sphingobacteriales bacterium]|nr:hypothetical protein [Sphingobacteriales bacterium]
MPQKPTPPPPLLQPLFNNGNNPTKQPTPYYHALFNNGNNPTKQPTPCYHYSNAHQ